ncbi:Integrin-like protein [Candidatus Koribacter versatilis Ellin345]|uniref:Integrin-like protein n=1 Tax=Koribacter versatilis (strain Ellin345) TaxID=204669 RepID=Q1IPC5_KORVE|nr:VCBS repeat-containing protein [Candidatus Koribacter versatilis]ABF41275.1 Integrin-like protein [Candidatus Koribacter versatilis Ellin345]
MRVPRLLVLLLLWVSPVFAQVTYKASFYTSSGTPGYSALADFNRDGYPDMAIVNSGTIDIFFNDHSGGFGAYTSYNSPSGGPIIAVDVNGDGWPDLVIAGGGGTVLLNNGDGTFRPGTAPTTKAPASSFVAGDFNKDGKVDLAAVEGTQIEILLNNGSGTFHSGQVLAMAGGSSNAVVGDFDSDGNLDIANVEAVKTLVWWGKGDGTFAAPLQIARPNSDNLSSIAAADFNNDGLPDLAVSSNGGDSNCDPNNGPICGTTTAHIYKNLGARKFALVPPSYTMGPAHDGTLFAVDLDGDLNPDLVNLFNAAGVYSGDLSYRAGKGNGTFGDELSIDSPSAIDVQFRDLNLDSRTDVVVPEYFPSSEVNVYLATSGYKNCTGANSAALHAKVCAPANNATVSSPVLITAAGNSPIGVQRLEVWVDGKKVYQKLGDQMNKRIPMTTGRHRVAVVAVDKYIGTSSTVEYVNVQ